MKPFEFLTPALSAAMSRTCASCRCRHYDIADGEVPLICWFRAGRFAKGSSGNPRVRPPGIRNPRRRVPDLAARPLCARALPDLLDRKPHLLRPLTAQLLPPPAAIDTAEHLGIDVASLGRSRIASKCCTPFWRPLRAVGSRARRRRAHRAAGRCPAARRLTPRTVLVF